MNPCTMSFDVGIGDAWNAFSFMSPEKVAALGTIYHSWINCGGSAGLIDVMKACPAYRHVKHKGLRYPTEVIPGAVPCLRDHAISHRLTYHELPFLSEPLDCEVPEGLPEDFVYITHSTPKNGPGCTRWITPEEWPPIIARLESLGTVGLVVNSLGGRSVIPDHPRLIDFTGRTTLPQAIEVLKRSRGYIGVDSNAAILAAQLFKPADLWIRTQNPYLADTPWWTYPPQADYSFLCPRFDRPNYPDDRPAMKPGTIVELRCNALQGLRNFTAGARIEVDHHRAKAMIDCGQALAVPPEALE